MKKRKNTNKIRQFSILSWIINFINIYKFFGLLFFVCCTHVHNPKKDSLKKDFCQGSSYQGWNAENYCVEVNYNSTVKEMIAAGNYGWVAEDIPNLFLNNEKKDIENINLIVVSREKQRIYNARYDYRSILNMLNERCLRPATIYELLAIGAKYPDLTPPIVALGSIKIDPSSNPVVVSITWMGAERQLSLDPIEAGWHDYDRFLAVRE